MRTIVWMLAEILRLLLRLEHKLDILIRDRKPADGGFLITPQIQDQIVDPVTGRPVEYTPVQLRDHGFQILVRKSTVEPTSMEPPKTVGD